jgi:hypothetical protein
MKKVLLFIIFLPVFSISQVKTTVTMPVDSLSNKITFSNVTLLPTQSTATIFLALRNWIATTSMVKDKKIVVADSSSNEITAECLAPLNAQGGSMCFVNYSITFYIKPEKFKGILTNFTHVGCDRGSLLGVMPSRGDLDKMLIVNDSGNRKYYDNILNLSKEHANAIMESFVKYVKSYSSNRDF